MNNQQFRRLIIENSKQKDGGAGSPPSSRPSATPALGSRKRSSIPMTPRQIGRNSVNAEFARQLAERNAKANPQKKFKSSAPKGVKLAAGYTDRTKAREDDDEADERVQRIKALEESMKLGQIDRETFEKLVLEITGGEITSTHLVKGLDRKLLERIRKGEDVIQDSTPKGDDEEGSDIEDELDELAEQEVAPVIKEKIEKKGEMAPPPSVAGVKRSRDAILAELKAQRKAAVEAAAAEREKKYPTLGPGFRKVGPGGETTRIEHDAKGREVLVITDADGKEKRKVRKQKVDQPQLEPRYDIEDPNKPLHINMENMPPSAENQPDPPKEEESDDDDIFAGVGSNYNPLANIEDEDDDDDNDSSEEDQDEAKPSKAARVESSEDRKVTASDASETREKTAVTPADTAEQPSSSEPPSAALPRRNYFNDTHSSASTKEKDAADATVLAALKKVRTLDANSTLLQDSEEARLKKRAAELAAHDRDMEDLDMGFGGSRFDDAEEMEQEGVKVKFSEWKGLGAEEDDEEGQGGSSGKKRKRGPKKKKGDKNSAADVLQVIERQKGAKTLG